MKYTHGADRREGSHLTDLIGDGLMFCKVLRIVFKLFFFVSIGLQVPRFSELDGSAAEPCFLFLLGSQYPISPGLMVRLLSLLFVSIGIPVPRFSGPLESLCTFFRVTNSKNSTDSNSMEVLSYLTPLESIGVS